MESDRREDDEHHERDHFLYHLELHQAEGPAVTDESDAVSRHLEAVLEESDTPRQQNDKNERRGIRKEPRLLQFQMPVPGQRHKHI